MFSFRQEILASYTVVFVTFIVLMFPLVNAWVHHIVISNMEERATEIISYIKDAPNHDALIRRLKDQKSLILFRMSVIDDQRKVLYDTHIKRKLGPKFTQDYVVSHLEVMEALEKGTGYRENYLDQFIQVVRFIYRTACVDPCRDVNEPLALHPEPSIDVEGSRAC